MDGRDDDLGRMRRLITFLPYNLVEEVVVDGGVLEPRIGWVEGCLLSATLTRLLPRNRRSASAADEELERAGVDLARTLRRILEETVFPRGGYLLKFSDAGILVMFTSRQPGDGPGVQVPGRANPARRAVRCGVELLWALKNALGGLFTARAGVEQGRFRLALCGRPGVRLEQLVLGSLCHTVAQLRDAAQTGELAAGPAVLDHLEGCGAHIGPQRGPGRRVVSLPEEAAAPRAGIANLESLFTPEAENRLRVLVPPAVVERVEAAEHALIGQAELRPVAVAAFPLHADYRDDADDPAVLVDLSAGVETILAAVEAHGGMLLRLDVLAGGSAALAAFGLSSTLKKAARDAVQCALWLSRRMAKKRSAWQLRAGVDAGRAFLGEMGSPLKRELALVGGPAAVALDLARQAGEGQVLVGETAWRLVGARAQGRGLGQRDVGDPPRRLGVWEAASVEPPGGALAVSHSPPHGSEPDALAQSRSGVRARLLDMLQRVIVSSQGCAVVIHGPPGRGKSSLLSALAEHGARLGFGGHVVRCPSEPGIAQPSLAAHLVRELLGAPAGASWDAVAEHVRTEVIPGLGGSPADAEPLLGLMGLAPQGSTDPVTGMDLVLNVLDHRSRQTPLLLGVEDLENADAQSLQLLARIMAAAPALAVMVAATAVSEDSRVEHALRPGTPTWVTAPPLGRAEARAVFLGFLGGTEAPGPEAEKELDGVLPRAAGNPSLLRELAELCRARMREGHSLAEACRELQEVTSPGELSQLRLDALSAPRRDLARLSSVLGLEFESVLLWRVLREEDASLTVGEMLLRAGELVSVGVLSPTLVGQVAGYRFRERSLRDVAYRSWPLATRTLWHRRVAAVLEKAAAGELTGGPARLAQHLRSSDEPLRAVAHLRAAAQALEGRGELDPARDALCGALTLLVEAGPREVRPLELDLARIELRAGLAAEAHRWAGSVTDDAAAPPELRAEACCVRGHAALEGDDTGGAIAAADAGRRLLGKSPAPELQARLRALHVLALVARGEADRALTVLEEARAELPEGAPPAAALFLDHAQATTLFARGHRADAERALDHLLRHAGQHGPWLLVAHARALLGARWLCVHPAHAVAPLRAALSSYEAHGYPGYAAACRWDLARALLRVSQRAGVPELVAESRHQPAGITRVKALALAVQAQLLPPEQDGTARRAMENAAAIAEQLCPSSRIPVMLELARAASARGDAATSLRWLDGARAEAVQARRRDLLEDVEAEAGRELDAPG